MSLPTFVSQNLGAKKIDRAKKGSVFGILFGVVTAEILGVIIFLLSPPFLKIFVDTAESIAYGTIHAKVTALFFFLLAFSHCAAGVLRGLGKAFIPMITMLAFWCGVRVIYVTGILKIIPEFKMISWAYPLTWSLSSIVFLIILLRMNWEKV
jgi:Na+-driven multidrug efflux pump